MELEHAGCEPITVSPRPSDDDEGAVQKGWAPHPVVGRQSVTVDEEAGCRLVRPGLRCDGAGERGRELG